MENKRKYLAEYAGFLFLKAILRNGPVELMMRRADSIGGLIFRSFSARNRIALSNIRYALGDRFNGISAEVIAQRSYGHLFRTIIELCVIRKIEPRMEGYVHARNLERFERALKGGRGAILVTGHFGNFELGALALACAGLPVSVVVKPLRNPLIDREITRLRTGMGTEVIPVNDTGRDAGRRILSALRSNRIVCLLSDQDVGLFRGILVDFFGHPTSTPTGPARMALQTRAPLFPTFICRVSARQHILEVEPPIEMDHSREKRENEIRRVTQEIALKLEGWITRYPEQYFWLHRRWKSTPDGARLYPHRQR